MMSNLEDSRKKEGTNRRVRMMEGSRKHMSGRLRGATPKGLLFFFPSVSKADSIDFSNLKHSHSRTFHRPIDWNRLPWGSLVL